VSTLRECGAFLPTILAGLLVAGCFGGTAVNSDPTPRAEGTSARRAVAPPHATPLPQTPAAPAGDGTTATISTTKGDIVLELFNRSAPVASENFVNLAEAGFYEGVVFHRIVPGFMIQGGDPTGTGRGGPGYTISDEPFAGQYVRGTVAMARTPAPNSQGSQFFVVVGDATFLDPTYTIFARVTSGMEVADAIAGGPRGGPRNDEALEPVAITKVTIGRPAAGDRRPAAG
jgi:cyclophilin family peptidyl-prolyl cis-trans isomerase